MISDRSAFNGLRVLQTLALAVALTALIFAWQGRQGFELWDEGFLWYGAQRVLHGETPILDFMAYDPGRYYWSAAWMGAWHDTGIVALRAAAAFFQALGVALGIYAISREARRGTWPILAIAAVLLTLWMYPAFKVYDVVPCVVLVYAYAALLQEPSSKRHLLSGIAVGLMAVLGRNHGVYGIAGGLLVMAYLCICARTSESWRQVCCWVVGIIVGYSPVIVMALIIPGFTEAMLDSVRFLFQIKGTNLALPVPWPWAVQYGALTAWEGFRGFVLGCFFIAIPIFSIASIVACMIRCRRSQTVSPLFAASAAMSLPYAHYVFSRADIVHLAQGITPFLIGMIVWTVSEKHTARWPVAAALLAASLTVMGPIQPGWQCHISPSCVDATVANDHLKIEQGAVNDLAMLDDLARLYASDGRPFIAAPFWPGAYAVLKRKAPVWEIYALFPRSAEFQLAEIERIQKTDPGFVLILDISIDGNEQTRFRNSHSLVFEYLDSHFVSVGPYKGNPAYLVYRHR